VTGRRALIVDDSHRVIVAPRVGVAPPAILDVESRVPHAGAIVAARRRLHRLQRDDGRLIDVSSADALSVARLGFGCSWTRANIVSWS